MSSASARHAISPRPLQVAAAVLGTDAPARRRIAGLLAEGGFAVRSAGPPAPDALVLHLGRATDAVRVREVRTLCEAHPGTRVLAIVPADATSVSLRRVLLAGAAGIVLDEDLERTLVPTARAMLVGQLTVPAVLGRQIAPRPLSHREREIVALVVQGRTNREIAGKLFLAESTVKTHLVSAFRKLDARSRAEAVERITDRETGYGTGILTIDDAGKDIDKEVAMQRFEPGQRLP
jgi:DNA-binding NarL/FixJ family response regulator